MLSLNLESRLKLDKELKAGTKMQKWKDNKAVMVILMLACTWRPQQESKLPFSLLPLKGDSAQLLSITLLVPHDAKVSVLT